MRKFTVILMVAAVLVFGGCSLHEDNTEENEATGRDYRADGGNREYALREDVIRGSKAESSQS